MYYPDEHQQGVEIAYDMVYGGGNLTWEWDPNYALRPVLHPLIYALLFKILQQTYLDYNLLVVYGPNILHALLWFVGDFYMYKLLKENLNLKIAKLTVILNMISWYP
jgi:phosphatidylinositol glycan class B